jgi:molecular chaperone GrpE
MHRSIAAAIDREPTEACFQPWQTCCGVADHYCIFKRFFNNSKGGISVVMEEQHAKIQEEARNNTGDRTGDDEPTSPEDTEATGRSSEDPAPQISNAALEDDVPVDPLEECKQQLAEQSDRYLRLMAEFDNYKKRTARDFERLVESANERLISELIEVRENLERAVKAGEQSGKTGSFFEGMKMIFSKFDSVLSKNGLESFGTPGDLFDPELHDAIMKSPKQGVSEDHIADVFEKGYRLKQRVIRHAKVVVSSGEPESKKEDKIDSNHKQP